MATRRFQKLLYFDYNSTTPVLPSVSNKIKEYLDHHFGNPSSTHSWGRTAHQALENSRKTVSSLLNASPVELYFTSCATESNNMVIFGSVESDKDHIITSSVEHPSVIKPCKYLESKGNPVTYLPVDSRGIVDLNELRRSITKNTKLISVMMVNNETGVLQPVEEIGKIAEEFNVPFHTDASQAVGKIKVDVRALNVDFLSFAGNKFYAPKGVGGLFMRKRRLIRPLIYGGEQERTLKSGTENVPYIVGMGEAARIALNEDLSQQMEKLQRFREVLINKLMEVIPAENMIVHGEGAPLLSTTACIGFKNFIAGDIIEGLNLVKVGCSAGAACHGNSTEMSHVLKAMNVNPDFGRGTIRFSMGRLTEESDVYELVDRIKYVLTDIEQSQKLR